MVFERSCGATTGYSIQASILDSDEDLENEAGNLFVVGENAFDRPSVDWVSDRELKLSYSPNLDIQIFEDVRDGVKVTLLDGR